MVGVQDDDRALLQLRFVPPQHLHQHRRRLDRRDAMRPEQHDARPAATAKGQQAAEVEIMGQEDEPAPSRSLEHLRVGSRAVTDRAPMPRLDTRMLLRLDPARRQVHVDENPQLEPIATSCSSLRHAAYASAD